ncbi:MAG: hypothetical protein OXF56_08500, partial [Rhodobacteraceae bacterium]|nr:hypothetical protein [Paracoccaceae bacterium]
RIEKVWLYQFRLQRVVSDLDHPRRLPAGLPCRQLAACDPVFGRLFASTWHGSPRRRVQPPQCANGYRPVAETALAARFAG